MAPAEGRKILAFTEVRLRKKTSSGCGRGSSEMSLKMHIPPHTHTRLFQSQNLWIGRIITPMITVCWIAQMTSRKRNYDGWYWPINSPVNIYTFFFFCQSTKTYGLSFLGGYLEYFYLISSPVGKVLCEKEVNSFL